MNLRLKSSGLDKWIEPESDYDVKELDDSFIERAIYRLFYIDVIQHIRVKAILTKQFHLSPRDIDAMPYWEYELWIRELNEQVKEENEAQQEQMDKYKINETMSDLKSGKLTRNAMPNMQSMSMPKMPSFNMKSPF